MKPLLIAICVLMIGAIPAFGQITGGNIGLFSDNPGASDCFLQETLYANNSIYVVHEGIAEGNTAQFMVTENWAALTGSVSYFANLNLGDPYTGVTITYVGCKPLPHFLAELQFIPTAVTPPCTAMFEVVPDPALVSEQIEIVDCSTNVRFANGGILYINGNENDCPCADPVEESTWGKVKSLYQ